VASLSYAAIESLAVVYAARSGGGQQWIGGVALAASALVSLAVTPFVPTEGVGRLVQWTAGLTCVGGVTAIAGFVIFGRGATGIVAFAIAGILMVVIVPANVLVAPRLPDELRASALSLLMGALVASQAIGAMLGGVFADVTSPVVAAVLLALPAAIVGAIALGRPIAVDQRPPVILLEAA
jgi:MFS family permease